MNESHSAENDAAIPGQTAQFLAAREHTHSLSSPVRMGASDDPEGYWLCVPCGWKSNALSARCRWCGEPESNCPNGDGEYCCLPCYEHGPAATHPRVLPPGKRNS